MQLLLCKCHSFLKETFKGKAKPLGVIKVFENAVSSAVLAFLHQSTAQLIPV